MFRRNGTWIAASLILFVLATSGLTQNPGKDNKNPEAAGAKSGLPLEQMVKSITEQPLLSNQSFYYDSGFKAIGSYSIHDHFAKRMCMGYRTGAQSSLRLLPARGRSAEILRGDRKKERAQHRL